jgi:hypothetical protein
MDVGTVADELYGLSPSEFTAQRDARATEARKSGDRSLASEIKKLRRPTTGAWLANLLVRERRDEVDQLLALGAALRQAQSALAAGDLRKLSQERHRLLAGLEKEGRNLADRHGQPVSAAVAQELSATLEAALADPGSADALRAGRLTSGLHYSGLGPSLVGAGDGDGLADLAPAPATRNPAARNPAARNPATPDTVAPDVATLNAATTVPADRGPELHVRGDAGGAPSAAGRQNHAEAAAMAAARAALAQAEAALAQAEQDAGQKRARLDEAREKRDRCSEEVADLERQLRAVRKREETADDEVRAAKTALDSAERSVITARDELVRARATIGRSSSSGA